MNKNKITLLLCSAFIFCIIILTIFAVSDSKVKRSMINNYDLQCHSLLKDMISDAAKDNEPLEQELIMQLKDRLAPSSSVYGFLAGNQKLLFVRDDMTTEMFADKDMADFIAIVKEGAAYQINAEKIHRGGTDYTVGIYTKADFIYGKYGYDAFERIIFLCLTLMILASTITLYAVLHVLGKMRDEREKLMQGNKAARIHIENLQEALSEGVLNYKVRSRNEYVNNKEETGKKETDSASEPGNYDQYRFSFYLNANHGIYIDSEMGEVHPHTWQISIHAVKSDDSFVMFSDVERAVESFLSKYQNKLFNDFKPFDIVNPTLENITAYLLENMQAILNEIGWFIFNIEVSETPARSYVISLL